MADKGDSKPVKTVTTADLKVTMFKRLEASTEPTERRKVREKMEELLQLWQTRKLISEDDKPGLTVKQRKAVVDYENGEYLQHATAWEKAGKKGFGTAYRAFQKAEKRKARATSLLFHLKYVPPNAEGTICVVKKAGETKDDSKDQKTHISQTPQLYPDLSQVADTPAYLSNSNPFPSTSIQAPVYKVSGGVLELEENERSARMGSVLKQLTKLSDEEQRMVEHGMREHSMREHRMKMKDRGFQKDVLSTPVPAHLPHSILEAAQTSHPVQSLYHPQSLPNSSGGLESMTMDKEARQMSGDGTKQKGSQGMAELLTRTNYHDYVGQSVTQGIGSSREKDWGGQKGASQAGGFQGDAEKDPSRKNSVTEDGRTKLTILEGSMTVAEEASIASRTRRQDQVRKLQAPLMTTQGGNMIYQPWSHRDLEGLVSKLPPLSGGGQKWISEFEKYTAGDRVCVGDLRCVIARLEGSLKAREIDTKTGCSGADDELPFNACRNHCWTALRDTYPTTRSLTAMSSLKKGIEEDMHLFLKRSEGVWIDGTGERHDFTPAVTMLWRNAVIKALPPRVREQLEDVVGLDTKSNEEWREYLVHHDLKNRKTEGDKNEEVNALTKRLLRMQVAEKDSEASRLKREKRQMVMGSPAAVEFEAEGQAQQQAALESHAENSGEREEIATEPEYKTSQLGALVVEITAIGSKIAQIIKVLSGGAEARSLGPMVKKARTMNWLPTNIARIWKSDDETMWKITHHSMDVGILEQHELERDHGREHTNHPDTEETLKTVPHYLWATGDYDVGYVPNHQVSVTLRPGQMSCWLPQYNLKKEQIEGIGATITGLLGAGVIRPSNSTWNTPILPVPKAGNKGWRMVHDLRRINSATVSQHIPVPDPYVALQNLNPEHKYFTVIDLANAFFCLPLDPEVQDLFAFTYRGQRYTYNRMPQGYKDSPGLFNQALKKDLTMLHLPQGVTLIQYVDDLLLAGTTAESCLEATADLLALLARAGYKVKKEKTQVARRSVTFLGRLISANSLTLTNAQRTSILSHGKPKTVQHMLAFLGLTGYSRTHVPEYVNLTQPLRDMLAEAGNRNLTAELIWTIEGEEAFTKTKQALGQAAHLCSPDYNADFHLDVSETEGMVNGVLFQKKGGERHVLMYHSSKLDSVELGQTGCARHLAALAKTIKKTAHVVMCHPLKVNTTHGVVAFLNSQAFTFSPVRKIQIEEVLTKPHITYVAETINMATGLNSKNHDAHDCAFVSQQDLKIRSNLEAEPLQDPEQTIYSDGCCYKGEEGNVASYAVVQQNGKEIITLEACIISQPASAQLAEIVALTQALKHGEGKRVNIYTDSAYAHGAVHIDGPQWIRRGFLTSSKTPVRHTEALKALLKAVLLPSQVAVIKCKGHQKTDTAVAKGNDAADKAAKLAGGYIQQMICLNSEREGELTLESIKEMQKLAGPYEQTQWVQKGAAHTEGLWRAHDGRLVAPAKLCHMLIKQAHGPTHVGKLRTTRDVEVQWWHPYMKEMVENFVTECDTCNNFNDKRTYKCPMGRFPVPDAPFKEICIDYTDMGADNVVRGYRYILVMVDRFTRWIEAIPCKKEDANSGDRCLALQEKEGMDLF
ncbi:uncharacterized protein LOC115015101 [Cottoperca gobio]|uniref:ribonuclease H n=1 Tax=Cottoperca gobio TaxID=56716 RepID=A0A6J2QLD0_COTGO|nr:uncharacterized protein LOC115015101 [Cottoperca gobio]